MDWNGGGMRWRADHTTDATAVAPSRGVMGVLRDRRGATLPMMVAGLIPMIGSVGSAIDLGRIYIAKSQMQAGVDAAALAGANAFDNKNDADASGRRMQVINYFRDNFGDSYMGVQKAPGYSPISTSNALLEPEFTTVKGISQTVVKATADLPMTFMGIFGVGSQRISVTAHAQFQPHPLEVMVVLDNTGSMNETVGGKTKISSLKTAVHSFLNVLYQGADSQPDLAVGIINYTIATNVGAILQKYGVATESVPGFTDGAPWNAGTNPMGWKGCVANDETVADLSASSSSADDGAYDLWNGLPGERPRSGLATSLPATKPFLYPPTYFPFKSGGAPANRVAYDATNNPTGGFHTPSGNINLYPAQADLETVANSTAYKRHYYRLFIGLNNGAATMDDDVIVLGSASMPSYYDPTMTSAFDPVKGTGTDFYVRTDNIPADALKKFAAAKGYVVASNSTAMPSPNWQCPQPGKEIAYGVLRSTYDKYVDDNVWAVQPANGTMHHTGFLWGWRLLSRYDKFTRDKPSGSAAPTRALVFMTDGETALGVSAGQYDRVNTAYGTVIDGKVTARAAKDGTTYSNFIKQVDMRFAKTCAYANSTVFADSGKTPQIYVVAINGSNDIDSASSARLKACGASGYWLTTTPDDLNTAFSQIARTLIDVHLTR